MRLMSAPDCRVFVQPRVVTLPVVARGPRRPDDLCPGLVRARLSVHRLPVAVCPKNDADRRTEERDSVLD